MGNNKKIGGFRSCYKKRKNVGKPKLCGTSTPRPTVENTPDNPSEPRPKKSSSNLKLGENLDQYNTYSETLDYDIINLEQLNSVLGDLAECRFCKHKLQMSKKSLVGLATKFRLFCSNCEQSDKSFVNCKEIPCLEETYTEQNEEEIGRPRLSPTILYDLNLRLVYALRVIGKGYTAAQSLCGILNLPPPPTQYACHEVRLAKTCQDLCVTSMTSAIEEAVLENDNEAKRDLCVALDGSWQKRGHTSLNGEMTLTSVDTGKVLDFHPMSKHCICPGKVQNNHLNNCIGNYIGTSGGMEVEGALTLFRRSVEKYDVRYTDYLGDGDSSAYKTVADAKPYGDVTINKQECIGHVQKRMGKRLRDLKLKTKGKLSDGQSISGKNRLTSVAMQKIQTFYGLAIRRNTHSAKDMQKAIWASYYHIMSTNQNAMHQLCPKGNDSWCKYKKSLISKEKYDHCKHFHLPETIMILLKPIFKQLADPELLKKCLKGKSQNTNESLNHLIWARLPKRTFVTLRTLKFGVAEAVLSFNSGYITKVKVMEHLGLQAGRKMVKAMEILDRKRMYESDKAANELEKKIRQKRTLVKRKLEDIYAAEEDPDNPTYCPGGH